MSVVTLNITQKGISSTVVFERLILTTPPITLPSPPQSAAGIRDVNTDISISISISIYIFFFKQTIIIVLQNCGSKPQM